MDVARESDRSREAGSVRTGRRGLIAGAAILVTGLLAKQAAQPVAAAAYNFQGDSATNVGSSPTTLTATAGFAGGTTLFTLDASPASGNVEGLRVLGGNNSSGILGVAKGATSPTSFYCAIYGTGRGTGSGLATGASGVLGDSTNFVGVRGFSDNYYGVHGTGGTIGVLGDSPAAGSGVVGTSLNGTGIQGQSSGNGQSKAIYGHHTAGGYGVYGDVGTGGYGVTGVATNAIGVLGQSDTGVGVYGQSSGGNGVYGLANAVGSSSIVAGVYGTSAHTYGILGSTTAAGYSGLTATTNTPGVAALAATALVNTAFAAYFSGLTYVQGNFTATGVKNAAVMHPDGTRRLFYCTEAPEPWFEDYGKAKFSGGKGVVTLDPEFALFIHTDDYHIFLTEYDDHNALYVTKQTATGFEVHAKGASGASGTFGWRVVGKRKDVLGKRLEKFVPIKYNIPDPVKLPKPVPLKKP